MYIIGLDAAVINDSICCNVQLGSTIEWPRPGTSYSKSKLKARIIAAELKEKKIHQIGYEGLKMKGGSFARTEPKKLSDEEHRVILKKRLRAVAAG